MKITITKDELNKILYSQALTPKYKRHKAIGSFKEFLKMLKKYPQYKGNSGLDTDKTYVLLGLNVKFYNPETFQSQGYQPVRINRSPRHINNSMSFYLPFLYCLLAYFVPGLWFKKKLVEESMNLIEKSTHQHSIKLLILGGPTVLGGLIAFVFRKRNIPTVIVQHGIVQTEYYKPYWIERELAQYSFVWGESFKSIYVNEGLNPEQIKVAAYPNAVNSYKKSIVVQNRKALIVGQYFYKFIEDPTGRYEKSVAQVSNTLKKRGFKVYYRPHPLEKVTKSLTSRTIESLLIDDNSIDVLQVLEDYSLVVGFSSTVLISAALADKSVIQIRLNGYNYDVLGKFSSIYTLDEEKLNEADIIEAVEIVRNNPKYVSKEYLNLVENPKEEYHKLYSKILKSDIHIISNV